MSQFVILTPTERAGSRLPKCSKMLNGGNKHDSSKIAEETPHEFQKRIFWFYYNFPK